LPDLTEARILILTASLITKMLNPRCYVPGTEPRTQQANRRSCSFVLATVGIVLAAMPSLRGQIRPDPTAMAAASPELIDRLRADPFLYFRFVNRAWTQRVCEVFADVPDPPIVRLHGDAHVGQFAVTKDAWGLEDFDDSARGPAFVDIVRFLGSIDLATRRRGWTRDRDTLWDSFFEGYRRGLSNPDSRPPEPDIVRKLRKQASVPRAAWLAWGEKLMQPMDKTRLKSVSTAMEVLERLVRGQRPELPNGYLAVKRAGWLHMGVGSALARKVLIRVEGPTANPHDDQLLEAKEVTNLVGVPCLEGYPSPPAVRIVDGTRQLGRIKHDILAVGPTLLIPEAADRAEHWLDWWVTSWEPSYREVHLSDLRSVKDLADIAFDSGVQLGSGKLSSVRQQALSSVLKREGRLRNETANLIEELLAGWRELGVR
jgi:hypothetical protein